MDVSQGIDNERPVSSSEISPKERLGKWIETGLSQDAVAVYGTSTERLRGLLRTHVIPSSPPGDMVTYKQDLANLGKLLYFCLPYDEALKREKPDIYREMISILEEESEIAKADLSTTGQNQHASIYAGSYAFDDRFLNKYGIDTSLGKGVAPEVEESLKVRYVYREDPDHVDLLTEVENKLREKNIDPEEAAIDANNRKGVLLFLNRGIFEGNLVIPTPEDEVELVIATDKPLTVDIITGIQVLSEAEEEELKKEYEI